MAITLAFDVYGTLIDTHGVANALRPIVGDQAPAFSQIWREKQLEYAFRRGLMQQYADFATCTRDALEYTATRFQHPLTPHLKEDLLTLYARLPPFEDVQQGLLDLAEDGCRLFAFSNGSDKAVKALLTNAGIDDLFLDIVSVDDLSTFKPNPAVYHYFVQKSQADQQNTWLISSNPFDVIGAQAAGLRTAWVRRSPEAIFDPWGETPNLTVESLLELKDHLPASQPA